MSLFVVDVEADGPAPGIYSMVSFGAIRVDRALDCSFYAQTAPVSEIYREADLAISGASREDHLSYPEAGAQIKRFIDWVENNNVGSRPVFVSDNPAFDWQWINWYCHRFAGENPFGHSARRVGDFCAGLEKSWEASSSYRALGTTAHTHNPADDAKRVAEGLIAIADIHGVKLPGVDKPLAPGRPSGP